MRHPLLRLIASLIIVGTTLVGAFALDKAADQPSRDRVFFPIFGDAGLLIALAVASAPAELDEEHHDYLLWPTVGDLWPVSMDLWPKGAKGPPEILGREAFVAVRGGKPRHMHFAGMPRAAEAIGDGAIATVMLSPPLFTKETYEWLSSYAPIPWWAWAGLGGCLLALGLLGPQSRRAQIVLCVTVLTGGAATRLIGMDGAYYPMLGRVAEAQAELFNDRLAAHDLEVDDLDLLEWPVTRQALIHPTPDGFVPDPGPSRRRFLRAWAKVLFIAGLLGVFAGLGLWAARRRFARGEAADQ